MICPSGLSCSQKSAFRPDGTHIICFGVPFQSTVLGGIRMKAFTLGAAIALAFSASAYAQAPSWTVPTENQRCPSKWGAADERGSINHQSPPPSRTRRS